VGDRVVKGQKILTLKNNELPAKRAQIDAGIAEATVALQNVKVNYDRMKVLWEQESITRKDWDDISAQYQMMKAKVNAAESMRHEIDEVITYTTVTAPISGVISNKMINMGDLVNPGVPLMTIEGDQIYEVVTSVSDAQISHIKKGMLLDVEIKSLGQHLSAVVSEISPSAVNTGGQFSLKAELKLNKEERKNIFPGMYANVYIDLPDNTSTHKTSLLMVDKSALVQRGQLTGLYTVSNQGTAMLRWVRTGKDFGDAVEIVTGLAPGEEYIVSDLSQLVDGTPVQK
jgi:RND family efflux transporter MFP subunit